jgi:hypothetical protein
MDLEFLANSSDSSAVPEELIFCLNSILKEWLPDSEKYVVTTSLSGKFNSYSVQSMDDSALLILKTFVESVFRMKFESRLILFNMPEALANDFLANVAMYHEIGHFVDQRFQIIDKIFDQEPTLNILKGPDLLKEKAHYREYFADLFAAQYIGDTCAGYVNYISYKSDSSATHPATDERVQLVDNFINGYSDPRINIIQSFTEKIAKQPLRIRYTKPAEQFVDEGVITVTSTQEMYGLFISGWECWLSDTTFPRKDKTKLLDGYKKLNGLIKSSIRNFMPAPIPSGTSPVASL